jgi:hypothetical protein
MGNASQTAVGTLAERSTSFVLLLYLSTDQDAADMERLMSTSVIPADGNARTDHAVAGCGDAPALGGGLGQDGADRRDVFRNREVWRP